MFSRQDFLFRQAPIPELFNVMSISQPQNELIGEHWSNLMAAIEVTNEEDTSVYLFYKSRAMICFMNFKEGALLYQKSFKVTYGQVKEITIIKVQMITIKINEDKRKEIVLVIGFMDGSLEIYSLGVGQKAVYFQKLISFQFWEGEQPVTTVIFRQRHMYVARAHSVWVYKECLSLIANIIIDQITNKGKQVRPYDYRSMSFALKLGNMNRGNTLHISSGAQHLHIYNQSEGSKSVQFQTLEEKGTIIDSIIALRQLLNNTLVIGDTNDRVKIIYKNNSLVERYFGFKNYCISLQHLIFANREQLWLGDMHGCLTYFHRVISKDDANPESPTRKLKMVDIKINYQKKICEHGIKKLKICHNLLFILDSQSNLHIFDIIRKNNYEHTVEIESVQYESSETYQ